MKLILHDTGNNDDFMIKLDDNIFKGKDIKGYELKRNVNGKNELIVTFCINPKDIILKNSNLKFEFSNNCLRCGLMNDRQ